MEPGHGALPGAPAPGFSVPNQYGEQRSLGALIQDRALVLVFFPHAFTPVCGAELSALASLAAEFEAVGARAVALSTDSRHVLRAFADQGSLSLELLSDFWPHGAVSSAYGALDERSGAARRVSVLVGKDSVVLDRFESDPGSARSEERYREALLRLPEQR